MKQVRAAAGASAPVDRDRSGLGKDAPSGGSGDRRRPGGLGPASGRTKDRERFRRPREAGVGSEREAPVGAVRQDVIETRSISSVGARTGSLILKRRRRENRASDRLERDVDGAGAERRTRKLRHRRADRKQGMGEDGGEKEPDGGDERPLLRFGRCR